MKLLTGVVLLAATVQAYVENHQQMSRRQALKHTCTTGSTTALILSMPQTAHARGRATLEQAFERYTPRIIAGGDFYKTTLRSYIEKSDWLNLKAATSEPPVKTKEDRSKKDGGVSDRAKLAGGFSDARVLVACDLFASTFSDNSISTKTKTMRAQVEVLRNVVEELNAAAREGLGETKGSGGFLGFGGSKPASQAELSRRVRELYVKGGNAYNQYIFAANDGLPVTLEKLPYL